MIFAYAGGWLGWLLSPRLRCAVYRTAHYGGINPAHNPQQAAAAAAVAAFANAGLQHRGVAGHGFAGVGSKVLLVNNLCEGVSALSTWTCTSVA